MRSYPAGNKGSDINSITIVFATFTRNTGLVSDGAEVSPGVVTVVLVTPGVLSV